MPRPEALQPGRSGSSRTRRRLLNSLLLAVIAGTIFGLLLLVFQTVQTERRQREQAAQTVAVLFEIRQVERAALNGETGQRGYLLTLDRRYLQPYLAARAEYNTALQRLHSGLGEDLTPRQRELLAEITALTRTKFAELDEVVGLVQQGRVLDARRQVLDNHGFEAMNRLRFATREMEAIESAILREAIVEASQAEARLLPLLVGLIAALIIALLFGYRLIQRNALAEAEAEGAAALAAARDRADLLASELNHRVKNLFAVVLAIVQMSARDAPEAKPVVTRIADRIRALLTAHEVTQGTGSTRTGTLEQLVATALAPYQSDTMQARIDGPPVTLPQEAATPLGLVLHELTTNAVKYGAWKHGGEIQVHWRVEGDGVVLEWRETGVAAPPQAPERQGFGSMLMTSSARQLGGSVERRFTPDGLAVDIRFPLAPR
ncbi:histidine kinase [Erythrobacteraceae bacterium CFH 75059]|uniref:sensor histidine kinase n=1 Tax=Qipengyuania thermophila TaxID=2509361 RepID=UPI00102096B4|nr:CHASE3 domain-containing protein [Qipengyuania thermophila]TCD04298.1 histidine kinase [Erythrobacteraceae bacterium CFH 75059]